MPSVSIGAGTGAAISGIGSLAGGAISAFGANSAAGQQKNALNQAITTQINEQLALGGMIQPYQNLGRTSADTLRNKLPELTSNFSPTMDQLAQTPGYQFTLQQGEQGVANQYSGQGLGNGVTTGATATTPSGPGVKGALNYAQGLASTTYQQQFQNYMAQNAQNYNILMGGGQLGEQASAAWGNVAQSISPTIGGYQSGIGAAGAAGTMGVANALGQGIGGAGNALGNYGFLNSLGGGSLYAGGGGGTGGLNVNDTVDQAFGAYA